MITLGIDLSSAKEGTAACVIEWKKTRAVAGRAEMGCDDSTLNDLIKRTGAEAVIGIDAPFGWPQAFVEAVAGWRGTEWSPDERKRMQFRVTDLYVQEKLKIWPLSVSTDRIALPAMRAMALLQRHGVTDRSGGLKFFEVYPAASLKSWGLRCRGYKLINDECGLVRREILLGLRKQMPWLQVGDEYAENSDALDALVASLTARAAAQEFSDKPNRNQVKAARIEGWIHLPSRLPTL